MATSTTIADDGTNSIVANYDTDYTVGQFVNGDWWVQENTLGAGVEVSSSTPTPINNGGASLDKSMHGIMADPDGNAYADQGLDERGGGYDSTVNLVHNGASDFPITLDAGKSYIFSESYSINDDDEDRPSLLFAGVLTVVAANDTPSVNDFRPPYANTTKTRFSTGDINWSNLPSLATPEGSTPNSLSDTLDTITGFWLNFQSDAYGRALHPYAYMSEYNGNSGGNANVYANAAVRSCLSDSQANKQALVYELLQKGIDCWGVEKSADDTGATYTPHYANGGLNVGCKLPMVFAAALLEDSSIEYYADGNTWPHMQEDEQTFYVVQADVDDCPKYEGDGRTRDCYSSGDIGTPEWGEKHGNSTVGYTRERDGSNWTVFYRQNQAGPSIFTSAVCAQLMSAEDIWGDDEGNATNPIFPYADRYYTEQEALGEEPTGLSAEMYIEYVQGGLPSNQEYNGRISLDGSGYKTRCDGAGLSGSFSA